MTTITSYGQTFRDLILQDDPVFTYITSGAESTAGWNIAKRTANASNNASVDSDVYATPSLNANTIFTSAALFFDADSASLRPRLTVPWYSGRENTSAMTFECLIRPIAPVGASQVTASTIYTSHLPAGTNNGYRVEITNTQVSLRYYNASTQYSLLFTGSIDDFVSGEIYHIVITVDNTVSGDVICYVNGVQYQATQTLSVVIPANAIEDGYIGGLRATGGTAGTDGFYFRGDIQYVTQYDKILTPTRVLEHYETIGNSRQYPTPRMTSRYDTAIAANAQAAYNFNSTEQGVASGGLTDISSNTNNGTKVGEIQSTLSGQISSGTCSFFNSSSANGKAYAEIPYNASLDIPANATFIGNAVLLIESNDTGENRDAAAVIFSLGDSGLANGQGMHFRVTTTRMRLTTWNGSSFVNNDCVYLTEGEPNTELEQTHHYAISVVNSNGGAIKFYRDGILIKTGTLTTAVPSWSASPKSYIGSTTDVADNLGGYCLIDDVAYHSSILSDQEIYGFYSVGSGLDVGQLDDYTARYSLDDVLTKNTPPADYEAFWIMDAGSTRDTTPSPNLWRDESTNNHDMEEVGTVGTVGGGFLGNNTLAEFALTSGNYLIFPSYNTPTEFYSTTFTLSFFFRHLDFGRLQALAQCFGVDTNSYGWHCQVLASDVVQFRTFDGAGAWNTLLQKDPITTTAHTHVMVTHDGATNELSLYIDNVLQDSIIEPNPLAFNSTNEEWILGTNKTSSGAGATNDFDGRMQGVHYYTRVLTRSELDDLHSQRWSGDRIYDNSLNGNDGNAFNGVIKTTGYDGLVDGALTFDGDSAYANFTPADLEVTGDFSVCAWFKLSGDPTAPKIISNQGGSGVNRDGYQLGVNSFAVADNTGTTPDVNSKQISFSRSRVEDSDWHHVAGVHEDGVELRLYLDGLKVASGTWTNGVAYGSNQFARIGSVVNSSDIDQDFMEGDLDDIRVYDRALSLPEVSYLHKTTIPPKPQDMRHEWKFQNANDNIGSLNWTEVGTPTYTAGWEDSALTLNGTSQYLTQSLASTDELRSQEFSVSLWFKWDDSADGVDLLGYNYVNSGLDGYGWRIRLTADGNGTIQYAEFDSSQTSTAVNNNYPTKKDVWTHVGVTRTSSSINLYVDAELVGTATPPGDIQYDSGSNSLFICGARNREGGIDDFFSGQIDEIRWYDRELT